MRTDHGLLVLALALLTPVTAAQAGPAKYSVVEIALPPDPDCVAGFHKATFARRLNERGEVTGTDLCNIATGDEAFPVLGGGSDAFRWHRSSGAVMLPSITPDAVDTLGRDINESGTVVGYEFKADGTFIAPLWPRAGGVSEAFVPQACDPEFGAFAFADGINDRGTVAAWDDRADENGVCGPVWILKLASGEELVGPPGITRQINNNDVVVGQSLNAAVRWSPATGAVDLFRDPTGQSIGLPWSINDRNEAVGQIMHMDDQGCLAGDDATFWAANAAQTTLGTLPGTERAVAFSINDKSQIVGYSFNEAPCTELDPAQSRAVIWRGTRAVDLNSLVPRRFAREFRLHNASAINNRGQIVARGIRRGEPKLPCPIIDFDPETGEAIYNTSIMCHNEYSFLLTPKH